MRAQLTVIFSWRTTANSPMKVSSCARLVLQITANVFPSVLPTPRMNFVELCIGNNFCARQPIPSQNHTVITTVLAVIHDMKENVLFMHVHSEVELNYYGSCMKMTKIIVLQAIVWIKIRFKSRDARSFKCFCHRRHSPSVNDLVL